MKIPFKAIAVLIILSLIGVFAYQAYWLTGLYSSMKKDMDNCLAETLQVSDYNEMMARCDSLKRNSNIDKYIKSSFEVDSIMTHAGNSYGIHIPNRIGLEINEPLSSTVDKNGTLELLTKYFQRGIHSQLDLFTEINLSTFDSLFNRTRYAGNHLPAPPYRNAEAARQGHDHCTKSELSARLHSKQESRFFLLQL